MTVNEVSELYHIPIKILKEYESWDLCGAVKVAIEDWQYDEQDLERLGMVMALHDIGFQSEEVEIFMRLLLEGDSTKRQRTQMLDRLRNKALDEIHLRERQLERMDYLRHEMRED